MHRQAFTRIETDRAGECLIDYLERRFTYLDRIGWEDHIALGRVFLNDRVLPPETRIAPGDLLTCDMTNFPEPPVDTDLVKVHEDEEILVINKPGNLPCHPGGRYFRHTLWYLLKTEMRMKSVYLVNRLDRETSGLVLVAKTAAAARACQRQFAQGQVRKTYEVWVEGDVVHDHPVADGFLIPDRNSGIRKKLRFASSDHAGHAACRAPGARDCHIEFHTAGRSAGISRLFAIPRTGATHQIRAALHGLGYPVVGDKLYGRDETAFLRFIEDGLTEADRRMLRLPRQALHAARLEIHHPNRPQSLAFSAPLPSDMRWPCIFQCEG